jgi:hypothetical protein
MKIKNQILQITVLFILVTTVSHAQFKNVGVGLAYGAEIEKPGILLNAQYFFSEKVALAPSFIFYFPETTETSFFGTTIKARTIYWELNADVNYYFWIRRLDSD